MYEVFTDGGCYPNPGPWGWAYILKREGREIARKSGSGSHGTNNVAELTAAIRGLEAIPAGAAVTLYSDSQYVTKGLNEWRARWKRGNWAGVKNDGLWRELDKLADDRQTTVVWVRGHTGHVENEECDRMASAAYRRSV